MTLKQAAEILGDEDGHLLVEAHIAGKVELRGRAPERQGWARNRQVIPPEILDELDQGGALRINVERSSIEAYADFEDYARFERGVGRERRDVVVAKYQVDTLQRSQRGSRHYTIVLQGKCEKWLTEVMMSYPLPQKAKIGYRAEAEEKFPGLGVRPFERAWKAAVGKSQNSAYSKAGKRPSNPVTLRSEASEI